MALTFAQSQAAKGKLAIKPVELPMHEGPPLQFGVRPLDGLEELAALEYARARAKAAGIENPTEDEPIYARYLMAATLARACVAAETNAATGELVTPLRFPEDAKALIPFFASPEEILGASTLGRDRIAYAYELYEIWQDEVSPSTLRLAPEAILDKAREIAEASTPGPFVGLRPGMRWIFTRSMAAMLLASQTFKSLSGGSIASGAAPSSKPGPTTSNDAGSCEP